MSRGPRYTPEEDRAILDAFTPRSVRIELAPAGSVEPKRPSAAAISASSTAAPLPLSRDPVTKRSP